MQITTPLQNSIDKQRKLDGKSWILKYSTLAVLLLIFLLFSLFVQRFFTVFNFKNIFQQIAILSIVGSGLTFGFAAKEMDLSVGYTVGLSGILVPYLIVTGWSLFPAICAAIIAGSLVGLCNSFLITKVGIPSLIATLSMGSVLYGINFLITGGRAIYGGLPDSFLFLGQGQILGIPILAYFMAIITIIAWFLLERTVFGRYIYAVGGNAKAAELSGIRNNFYRTLAMVICAVFATLAGILLSARLGSGQPNVGERYLLDGLAAVFIGMTMFKPGTSTILGTFFGALFIGIINNGLNLLGLDSYIQNIVKGLIIIAAVAIVSKTTKLSLL